MLTKIHDDAEKAVYIAQMKEIDEIICSQVYLPKNARVTKVVLEKLKETYDKLENEIALYEELKDI